MSNNDEHQHSDFGFAGPHTTFHHQCFQMVELTNIHRKRAMNGLNPCTLPYEPKTSNNKLSIKLKQERKLQVEELTAPNDYARVDNCVKTHDGNEE